MFCALVSTLLAALTASSNPAVSMVARVCPAVTFSPIRTGTVATVPVTANDVAALSTEPTVPTERTICSTDPTAAVAVR